MATQNTLSAAPSLQRAVAPTRRWRFAPLERWHLLSLDAPTVATTWTWSLARSQGVTLRWQVLVAMFIAVWMLYALDRLLDAWRVRAGAEELWSLEARHLFHLRHHRGFVFGLVLGLVPLACLLPAFPVRTLALYAILGLLLACWFALIHLFVSRPSSRLPKEFAVGVFFPLAVAVPTLTRLPQVAHLAVLLPEIALLSALCTANCLFIYAWEHPAESSRSGAHPATRFALRWLTVGTALLLAAPVCSVGWQRGQMCALAIALSAALLLALHAWRGRFAPTTLRAAADLALLTPLLFAAMVR